MLSTADFGADGRRCTFRVGELMAVPDRTKRNVVRDDQADGRLDLIDASRPSTRAVDGRRGDRPVHHVVDLVVLERKHLGQPAANFVEQHHRQQRLRPSNPASWAAATATG